jgi:hypothetical protein
MKNTVLIRLFVGMIAMQLFCSLNAAAQPEQVFSRKQFKTMLATAKTPSDEQKIAAYYRSQAQLLDRKAQEFSEQAALYAGQPATIESKQGISCLCPGHFRYFAKLYAQQAQDSNERANEHARIAEELLNKPR